MTRFCDVLTLAGLVVFATPSLALAYVDPGYGLLIWQTLAAGALGLGFKLYRMFGRMRQPEQKNPEDEHRAAE